MARLAGCAVVGLGLGVAARPALAQISPGRLSRGHARLEGSAHCLDCHEAKQGAAPAKCLACHTALGSRTRGLHSRPEYRDCQTCHVEHQGEEADLVWWGKAGRAAFDHAATGHPLAGRHARMACESCHAQRLLKDPERLRGGGANLARTYLGLDAECSSCHADRHRGTRLSGRACTSCHGQQSWKPAPFDHGRTAFALTGAHGPVPCASCHAMRAGEPRRAADAGGAGARQCQACHEDPHRSRLGPSCASCHSTAGWRRVAAKGFDHARTGYPLAGRHAAVSCDGCHRPGRPLRPARATCDDCHSDVHLGQLAAAGRTECERCHDVDGFTPARFAVERHQSSRFPLQGAHLAVACDRCHRRLPLPELARKVPALAAASARGGRATAQFRFAATGCADCHGDPHRGELARGPRGAECTACHTVDSWRTGFDHARTRFALAGPHARAACDKCHAPVAAGTRGARLKLGGLDTACQSCHRDPHQGQFVRASGARACESCHSGPELQASGFDHRRDSSFTLAGAHARAACASCHRREQRAGAAFTRYRPLPTACSACHPSEQLAGAAP